MLIVTVSNNIKTTVDEKEVSFVQNVEMNIDGKNLFELNEANNDGSKNESSSPTLTINSVDGKYTIGLSKEVCSNFRKQMEKADIKDDHLISILDEGQIHINNDDKAISVKSKNNEFIITIKSKDGQEYTLTANATGIKFEYGENTFTHSLGNEKHLDVNLHRDFATKMLEQEKPFATINAENNQDRIRSIPQYIVYEYCQGFANKDVKMQTPTKVGDFTFYHGQSVPSGSRSNALTDYVFIKDEKTNQVYLYSNGGYNECQNFFFTQDKNGKRSLDINFQKGGRTIEIDCQNPQFEEFFHNFVQINLPQAPATDRSGKVYEPVATMEIEGRTFDIYPDNQKSTINTRFSYYQRTYDQEGIASVDDTKLGPDGPDQTGPTGPTGPDQTGPTGPDQTGPTGPQPEPEPEKPVDPVDPEKPDDESDGTDDTDGTDGTENDTETGDTEKPEVDESESDNHIAQDPNAENPDFTLSQSQPEQQSDATEPKPRYKKVKEVIPGRTIGKEKSYKYQAESIGMSMGMIGLFLGILAPFLGPVVLFVGLGLTLGGIGLGALADKLEFKPYKIAEKTITKYEKLEEEERDLEQEMEQSASKFIDGEEKLDSLENETQGIAQEVMQFANREGDKYHPFPDFIEQVNTFAPISHPKDEKGKPIVSNTDYLDKSNLQYRQNLVADLKRINLMPEDVTVRTKGIGKNKVTLQTNKELKDQAIESFKQQFYRSDMSKDQRDKVSDTIDSLFSNRELLAEFIATTEKYNQAQEKEIDLLQSQRQDISGMNNRMLDKIYNNKRSDAQRREKLDQRHATAIIRSRAINNQLNTQENQELLNLVPEEERENHAQSLNNATQTLENEVREIQTIARDNVSRITNVDRLPKYFESSHEDNNNYATRDEAKKATLDYLYSYTQNYATPTNFATQLDGSKIKVYDRNGTGILNNDELKAFKSIKESYNSAIDQILSFNNRSLNSIKTDIYKLIDEHYADKIFDLFNAAPNSALFPQTSNSKVKDHTLENIALSLAKDSLKEMLKETVLENGVISNGKENFTEADLEKMSAEKIQATFNISVEKNKDGKDIVKVNGKEYDYKEVSDIKDATTLISYEKQIKDNYYKQLAKIDFARMKTAFTNLGTYPTDEELTANANEFLSKYPFLKTLDDTTKNTIIGLYIASNNLQTEFQKKVDANNKSDKKKNVDPKLKATIDQTTFLLDTILSQEAFLKLQHDSTNTALINTDKYKKNNDPAKARSIMKQTQQQYRHIDEVFRLFAENKDDLDKFRNQYNLLLEERMKDGKKIVAGDLVKATLSEIVGKNFSINGQSFDEILSDKKMLDDKGEVDLDKLSAFIKEKKEIINQQTQSELNCRTTNLDSEFANRELNAQRKAIEDPKRLSRENMMQVIIESGLADMEDIVQAFTSSDLEKGLKDLLKKCGLNKDQVDSVINAKFLKSNAPYKMLNSAQRRYIDLKNNLTKLTALEEKYNNAMDELSKGNLAAFKQLDAKECAKYGIKIDRILSAIKKHEKDGTEIKLDNDKIAKDIENNSELFRSEKNALAFNIDNQNKILYSTTERDARFEQAKLDCEVYKSQAEKYSTRLEQITKVFQNLEVTPSMAKQFMEAVASGNIQEFATNNSHIQGIADLGNMTQEEIDRYQSLGLSFKEFEKIAKSLKEDKKAKISEKKMKKALSDLAQFNLTQQENINKQQKQKEQNMKDESQKLKEQEKENKADKLEQKDKNGFLAKLFNFKNATKEKVKEEKEKTQKREEEKAKEERERVEAEKRAKEAEEKREKGEGEEASHDAKPEEAEANEVIPPDIV